MDLTISISGTGSRHCPVRIGPRLWQCRGPDVPHKRSGGRLGFLVAAPIGEIREFFISLLTVDGGVESCAERGRLVWIALDVKRIYPFLIRPSVRSGNPSCGLRVRSPHMKRRHHHRPHPRRSPEYAVVLRAGYRTQRKTIIFQPNSKRAGGATRRGMINSQGRRPRRRR